MADADDLTRASPPDARDTAPRRSALYYNKQAVANFTMHYMTQLLGQDDVVKQRLDSFRMARDAGPRKGMWASPTSAAVLEWKDAIRQPQRGS